MKDYAYVPLEQPQVIRNFSWGVIVGASLALLVFLVLALAVAETL